MKRSNAPANITAHAANGMRSMKCGREESSSAVGGGLGVSDAGRSD